MNGFTYRGNTYRFTATRFRQPYLRTLLDNLSRVRAIYDIHLHLMVFKREVGIRV